MMMLCRPDLGNAVKIMVDQDGEPGALNVVQLRPEGHLRRTRTHDYG